MGHSSNDGFQDYHGYIKKVIKNRIESKLKNYLNIYFIVILSVFAFQYGVPVFEDSKSNYSDF